MTCRKGTVRVHGPTGSAHHACRLRVPSLGIQPQWLQCTSRDEAPRRPRSKRGPNVLVEDTGLLGTSLGKILYINPSQARVALPIACGSSTDHEEFHTLSMKG
mmetsp:Transcript_58852/g.182356  ORF Transcript_58852/g.182356 Transcript_58852/m.182356 type:complete len:103 (-) Transcript_58852:284-592(-)